MQNMMSPMNKLLERHGRGIRALNKIIYKVITMSESISAICNNQDNNRECSRLKHTPSAAS